MRYTLIKKIASTLLAILSITTLVLTYQNCSNGGFQAANLASRSLESTLSKPPERESSTCSFNGDAIQDQQVVTAFQNSSVAFGETCVSEVRRCEGGRLSGSFNYSTCEVKSPAACLFNGRTIPHNGTVDAFQNSSVAFGASCAREARVCNDGVLSGSYQYASCTPAAPAQCLFNGLSVAHGATVVAYRNSAVAFGVTCTAEVRTCTNGVLSGSYTYGSCSVDQPRACTFNGRSIAHGETVTAFLNSSVAYGARCESQVRTCNNGTLTGSYNQATCAVGAPKTCLFNGQTIAHGQEVTAFQASTVSYGSACVSQARLCNDGALSGSYAFASCNVDQPASCLFNGQTVADGETITGFVTSRVPFGSTCRSVSRVCQNGVFTGDGSALYASCEVDQPAACLFNGQTIAHGQKVVAFASTSVPYGQNCSSQERVCSNGTLSGTSTAPTCEPENPLACTFNKQTVPHGSSIVTYQSANVAYGQSCVSETRTCMNGVLSGSYMSTVCTVTPAATCLFNGRTVAHGASVTAYASETVPSGQSCTSQQRTCTNGVLSGTYTNAKCIVGSPGTCSFNDQIVSNNASVTAYATATVPYGQSCSSEQRTCSNGNLSGSYTQSACRVEPPKTCLFDGQTIPHGASVMAYAAASVPSGQSCLSQMRTCMNGVLSGSYTQRTCMVQAP